MYEKKQAMIDEIPDELRAVKWFLKRADLFRKRDLFISYVIKCYVLEQIMSDGDLTANKEVKIFLLKQVQLKKLIWEHLQLKELNYILMELRE